MNPWRRKPDPFEKPTTVALGIDELIKAQQDNLDSTLIIPKQVRSGDIPYNNLVYALHALGDIYNAVPINRAVVELIQRRITPFSNDHTVRQKVDLNLLLGDKILHVEVWVIPIFSEGIPVYYMFAANQVNQQLLLQHRHSESQPYDITRD